MVYVITFLEGLISFISPCMLPMLPLYLSYFAGAVEGGEKRVQAKTDDFAGMAEGTVGIGAAEGISRVEESAETGGVKETVVEGKETVVEAKETVVGGKETVVEAKETVVGGKETVVEGKEKVIGGKETVVEAKETVVGGKETVGSATVGAAQESTRALPGAIAFVLGFTLVFCIMGLFAGTVGKLLMRHQTLVNWITGCIVIFLGLVFLDLIPLPFLKGIRMRWEITGIFSAFLFGMVFSVSLTPCIGAFLGSALMLASTAGSSLKGLTLLLLYSMGLGIPFVVSAVLVGQLQNAFSFIKRHYRVVNIISGGFLILVGVMMATGQLNRLLAILSI